MRRILALIVTVLAMTGITVSATTTPTASGGATSSTLSSTTAPSVTAAENTTIETTTTVPTTTTTTTKPTDKPVDSVQYDVEKLPRGATMHGEATWVDGRKNGKALLFNGTDTYIEINAKKLKAPFTLSLWVNWEANVNSSDSLDQRLFSFVRKNTENSISLTPFTRQTVENNIPINGIALFTDCYKKEWLRDKLYHPTTEAISNMLPTNTWHHVAFTMEDDTVTIYIDGLQWYTKALPYTFADLKVDALMIGAADHGVCLFNGKMQDIRLYENALTPMQVVRLSRDIEPFDATVTDTPPVYTPAPLPQRIILEQTYRIVTVLNGDDVSAEVVADTDNAFFEAPILSGGQSVTCALTVENKSKQTMNAALLSIPLPSADSAAYRYLSEIFVTVSQDETVLYSGPYTSLTADALRLRFERMPYGRRYIYTITLSRSFNAQAPYVACSVPWQFGYETEPIASSALPGQQPLTWLIILLPISILAVGFCIYWAFTRKPNRLLDWVGAWVKSILPKKEKAPAPIQEIQAEEVSVEENDI